MYSRTHRNIATAIIIVGHFSVFLFGFFVLGIGGGQVTEDFFIMILMASPVLASASISAFNSLLETKGLGNRGRKLPFIYTTITLGIPITLLACIFAVFALYAIESSLASPTDLKVSLGIIETFFGAYLGALSINLFSKTDK